MALHLAPLSYERVDTVRLLSYDVPLTVDTVDLGYVDGPTHPENLPRPRPPGYFVAGGDLIRWTRRGVRIRYAITDKRWAYAIPYYRLLPQGYDVATRPWVRSIVVSRRDDAGFPSS